MSQEKLHTHYDNLKVARNAPPEVIKAAYRVLSQRYHPDRNPGKADAHRVMALVNESYKTLSDPAARAAHDDWIFREESESAAQAVQDAIETMQRGAANSARSTETQKPRQPAEPEVPASARPEHQAERAKETAYGYSRFNEGQRRYRHHFEPDTQPRSKWLPPTLVLVLLAGTAWLMSTVSGKSEQPSRAEWTRPSLSGGPDRVHAPVAVSAQPTVSATSEPKDSTWRANLRKEFEAAADASVVTAVPAKPTPGLTPSAPLGEPRTAPNGLPWPAGGGYLNGYEVGAEGGKSGITVNNGRVGTPAHVQLFRIATSKAERHLLVPAHGRFTLEGIQPGTYEIRFRFLGDQTGYASERIVLQETDSLYGTQYDDVTMTLYKVQGGNMRTRPLLKGEF